MNVTVRIETVERRFRPPPNYKPKHPPGPPARYLFLTDPEPIVGSGVHKVSQVYRDGIVRYLVYERPRLPLTRECLPDGTAVRRWQVDETRWCLTDRLSEAEIWPWLTVRLGVPGAGAVLTALQSGEPIGE